MARAFIGAGKTRHTRVLLAAVFGALLSLMLVSRGAWGVPPEEIDEAPEGASYVAGELLVVYETDVPGAAAEEVPEASGGEVEEAIPEIDAQLIEFPGVKDEPTERRREKLLNRKREQLEQEPGVESVSLNYIYKGSFTPNDPLFGDQYALTTIRAPRAWDRVLGNGVDIAVVDTGIDNRHPDLGSKVSKQRNFVGPTATASAQDDNGHGTSVAGVAAAVTNNDTGVAGACPDCRLLVAKSLDASNSGTVQDVAEGITWAADNGAEVINLSLGAVGADAPAVERAITRAVRKGIVVVAAAGNEGTNDPVYPAAYSNVISVAATDQNNRRARFSSYGNTIDVAAPGVQILTTDIQGGTPPGFDPGDYVSVDGTSYSSSFTAGVAGLLAAQGRSATKIRDRIERTARDLGPAGRDNLYGHGLINAAAAVRSRAQPPNTAPRISAPRPKPGSTTKKRRPAIIALVRDRETDLRKRNITLILDGKKKGAFRYRANRDRLSYKPAGNLAPGRHTVRVIVRDGQGKKSSRKWRFKVKAPNGGNSRSNDGPFSSIRDPGFPFNVLPNDQIFDLVRK